MDGRAVGGASRWRMAGWGTAATVLMIPALAMLVTDEMNWGLEDFAAAALLLGAVGLAFEGAVRLVRGTAARVAIGMGLLVALLTAWAELAVGLLS